ncbi:MAG TPA: hypothetical protein VGR84_18690 [Candidatus Acidoferrales bacterium]|nr:hypothetical protein [Candidatus Acidoferrales bacterium]
MTREEAEAIVMRAESNVPCGTFEEIERARHNNMVTALLSAANSPNPKGVRIELLLLQNQVAILLALAQMTTDKESAQALYEIAETSDSACLRRISPDS